MWPFLSYSSSSSPSSSTSSSTITTTTTTIATFTIASLLPFAFVFAFSTAIALRLLFPRLSAAASDHLRDGEDHLLPRDAPAALRHVHAEHGAKSSRRRGGAWAFSVTVGLAATLGALIMAEISGGGFFSLFSSFPFLPASLFDNQSLASADTAARNAALGVTVPALLFMLVVLIPWLECRALLASAGWSFQRSARGKLPRVAMALQCVLFAGWLFVFWSMGGVLPEQQQQQQQQLQQQQHQKYQKYQKYQGILPHDGESGPAELLVRACLERIGVVGIALMALLSGFAAVSAPWHTFLDGPVGGGIGGIITMRSRRKRGRRPVTEADVNRKQAGLDATCEMLATKRHRLQALERGHKTANTTSSGSASGGKGGKGGKGGGLVSMVMGTLRVVGGHQTSDEAEIRALRIDIAGLETMEANLASSLSLMRSQQELSARAATPLGKLCLLPSTLFAAYCVYRILATTVTTLRRVFPLSSLTPRTSSSSFSFSFSSSFSPSSSSSSSSLAAKLSGGISGSSSSSSSSSTSSSFSSSDPINRILGLLARHWDPTLDQLAWSRIISFALSGAILLLSANSAVQTFHLFAKWTPGLLRGAQAVLALAVAQVAAAYVISAALLLRSQLPPEEGLAVGGVLRGALSPAFVDGWFEGWFLVGSVGTAGGLWLGRRVGGGVEDWDDYGMEEIGAKRS